MDRPKLYSLSNIRVFDHLKGYRDILKGFGRLAQALFGSTDTIVTGFEATESGPTSLVINIGEGQIYQLAAVDATAYASLPADSSLIFQQGYKAASTLTFNTSGLSSGESKWALVQATFAQPDEIRSDDPTNGVLAFFNSANPTSPLQGPTGDGSTLTTARLGAVTLQIIYGNAATTGTEEPPPTTAGYAPLYLVNLSFGQTTITNGQILVSGPDAHVDADTAPFAGGLYTHRHTGTPGNAELIDVTEEITGLVPFENLLTTSGYGKIAMVRDGAVDPNGVEAGELDDLYIQKPANVLWFCSTAGSTSTAVWSPSGPIAPVLVNAFPATITQTSGTIALSMSADGDIILPPTTQACDLEFVRIDSNDSVTGRIIPAASPGGQTINGASEKKIYAGDALRMQTYAAASKWLIKNEYHGGV